MSNCKHRAIVTRRHFDRFSYSETCLDCGVRLREYTELELQEMGQRHRPYPSDRRISGTNLIKDCNTGQVFLSPSESIQEQERWQEA